MIFNTFGLSLGVDYVHGAVKIGGVFCVYLSNSFRDLKLFGSIGGVENAEILTVGRDKADVVTALSEKSDRLTLGNYYVSNNKSAPLKMCDNVCGIEGGLIVQTEFFRENRAENCHIGANTVVCQTSLGDLYTLLNIKCGIGKLLDHHAGTAESAACRRYVDAYLFLGHIGHLDLGAIRNVSVFELIYVFHCYFFLVNK